jgi:radical SAM protein with 4Fe4S-binding SPASM domain
LKIEIPAGSVLRLLSLTLPNGDLYSCDHNVEPGYLLGNTLQTSMAELVASEKQRAFGREKLNSLPKYCRECEVRFACHGECPRNRWEPASSVPAGPERSRARTTLIGRRCSISIKVSYASRASAFDTPGQIRSVKLLMGKGNRLSLLKTSSE